MKKFNDSIHVQQKTINNDLKSNDYKVKINDLTEFNPALVYGFEPEESSNYEEEWKDLVDSGYQHKDMLSAYLYAQDILSIIKKDGISKIDSRTLLTWFNELHFLIAQTVANDRGFKAGEFATSQITRWHKGGFLKKYVLMYLAGVFEEYDNKWEKDFGKADIEELKGEWKEVQGEFTKDFLSLLREMRGWKPTALDIPEYEKVRLDMSELDIQGIGRFCMLIELYHNNKLTKEEQSAVEKNIAICMLPSKYKESMQKFAFELLQKWQACDPKNDEQIVKLVSYAFKEFTTIHPYVNCNGRLATLLCNIILRSFNQPSILMRNPGERSDPNSSYNQAINNINANFDLLTNHFAIRIKETKEKGGYKDELLSETIMLRVECSEIISKIVEHYPKHNIGIIYGETIKNFVPGEKLSHEQNTLKILSILKNVLLKEFDMMNTTDPRISLCVHAAQGNTIKLLQLLNEHGDKCNIKIASVKAKGCTSLHYALQNLQFKTAIILIGYGLDLSIKNDNLNTPLDLLSIKVKSIEGLDDIKKLLLTFVIATETNFSFKGCKNIDVDIQQIKNVLETRKKELEIREQKIKELEKTEPVREKTEEREIIKISNLSKCKRK